MVPGYVKLIVGLSSALVMSAGLRDIFMPGTGLPLPDDDKTIAAVFGAPPVGSCGKKAVGCVPGRMLFLSQGWGLMAATLSAVKLVAVFSHPEGTYLRRNLFATLGASSVAFSAIIYSHESYFNEQGASAMGFAAPPAVDVLQIQLAPHGASWLLLSSASCASPLQTPAGVVSQYVYANQLHDTSARTRDTGVCRSSVFCGAGS